MLIYLLLIIPIITTIVCFIYFKHEVVWWEYLLNFGAALACIFASKAIIQHIQVSDTEYWGGWVIEVRYYESWNEYIHRMCTQTVSCGKDCTITETYDCSYVQNHPAYWEILNSNGRQISISKNQYKEIVHKFGTGENFVDMDRNYHSKDGDMYYSKWNGSDKTMEFTTTEHRYENRVRVSSSTFAMKEPSKEIFDQYKLFHYPKVQEVYKQKNLLGINDPIAQRKLEMVNSKLGHKYEFRSYIMIFKNQPREAGFYQEEQWQGGNKNELNIAIGIDSVTKQVNWCHVFSWTDKRDLPVAMKNIIEGQDKLDLIKIIDNLESLSKTKWERKHFKDFSYLTVEPQTHHIVIAFIITLIINIGVTIFVVANDITEDDRRRRYY